MRKSVHLQSTLAHHRLAMVVRIPTADCSNCMTTETKHEEFIPPGYESRLFALMDVVRFGPALLPIPEFLALLFHAERVIPYNKPTDAASLAQMTEGIRKRDGTWIRGGSGNGRSTNAEANRALQAKGLLRRVRRSSRRGHEPTEYTINWLAVKEYIAQKLAAKVMDSVQQADDSLDHAVDKAMVESRTTSSPGAGQSNVRDTDIQSSSSKKRKQSENLQRPFSVNKTSFDDEDGREMNSPCPTGGQGSRATGQGTRKNQHVGEGADCAQRLADEIPDDDLTLWNTEEVFYQLYKCKAGRLPTTEFEKRLREILTSKGVNLAQFLRSLKPHIGNDWKNPPGFLTYFADHFAAETRRNGESYTNSQTEPEPTPADREFSRRVDEVVLSFWPRLGRVERCTHCRSPKGAGLKLHRSQWCVTPCPACARPEWIELLRQHELLCPNWEDRSLSAENAERGEKSDAESDSTYLDVTFSRCLDETLPTLWDRVQGRDKCSHCGCLRGYGVIIHRNKRCVEPCPVCALANAWMIQVLRESRLLCPDWESFSTGPDDPEHSTEEDEVDARWGHNETSAGA
jgi:ferredoxin